MESAQALTSPASASLTTPSAAANSSSIRVKVSTKRRLRLLSSSRSICTSRRKKLGSTKPWYSDTWLDSSQYKVVGTGFPLQ